MLNIIHKFAVCVILFGKDIAQYMVKDVHHMKQVVSLLCTSFVCDSFTWWHIVWSKID